MLHTMHLVLHHMVHSTERVVHSERVMHLMHSEHMAHVARVARSACTRSARGWLHHAERLLHMVYSERMERMMLHSERIERRLLHMVHSEGVVHSSECMLHSELM